MTRYDVRLKDLQRSRIRCAFLFVTVIAGCSAPPPSESPSPSATSTSVGPAADVVATLPASGGLSFALAPGKCADGKCAAVVRLLEGGRTIDSVPLDFAASEAALSKVAADASLGAGDPLDAVDALPAWGAGDGEMAVVTAARSVRLSPTESALLVDQSAGFEHVKRRHYLFVADDKKLRRVWTGEEGAGPTWSAAAIVDSVEGSGQEIVYLSGFQPGGNAPDTLRATRFGWDAAQKTLTQRTLGPLYAVVADRFSTIAAARGARAQGCLANYFALPGRDLGIADTPRIVLATITTRKALAEAALASTDNCPATISRRVVTVNLPPATP